MEEINIQGIKTNQDFLLNILQTEEFYESKIDTNFISDYYKDGFKGKTNDASKLEIMAIAALSKKTKISKRESMMILNNITKNWLLVVDNDKY